ncbi:MAG: hypothetical protein JNL74_07145 [Fibrobacteres bacterium]|nr:hypothetical protein [Fibrobacterota bacterium]
MILGKIDRKILIIVWSMVIIVIACIDIYYFACWIYTYYYPSENATIKITIEINGILSYILTRFGEHVGAIISFQLPFIVLACKKINKHVEALKFDKENTGHVDFIV